MKRKALRTNRLFYLGLLMPALVLSTALFTPLCLAQQPRAQGLPALMGHSYFPLETGNRWVYSVQGPGAVARTWEVKVTGEKSLGFFRSYFQLSGYFHGKEPRMVRSTIFGTVLEQGEDGKDYLWYELLARVGKSWEMDLAPGDTTVCEDGAQVTVGAREEVIKVPAGEFKQVVRLDFITKCIDAGITREWFAPGVGLIKREESSFGGPVVSELVYAEIGDKIIPARTYSTSLQLSASHYVNNTMPPVDPTKLPRVRGTFVVRDETEKPGVLEFPSGCLAFLLEVRNQAGEIVLSKNIPEAPCPAVVTRIDLAKEALVVPFSFTLADQSGKALPDGRYTIAVVLQAGPSARAVIDVSSVQ